MRMAEYQTQSLSRTVERRPRIVGALVGDVTHEPGARTKYGFLFEALGRRFPLVGVYNANLRGAARWVMALLMAHPNRRQWQKRFYGNIKGFQLRSQQSAAYLQSLKGKADVVLQVGVLFDARWRNMSLPSVIYTDYTMRLSTRNSAARLALNPEAWIALERQAYERARHICTRGQFVRESIIRDYGISPERVTAIGGGVNFATLPEAIPRPNSSPPTALFIGKELHRKGGDLLLQAFAQARSQAPGARLLFLTADPLPADLPLEGVEVIPPTWDRNEIAGLYRRADLFVLPSRLETWGDVLLEAMAHSLPCIGVSGQAMEDMIEEGKTGLNVPPGDVEALAAALVRLFCDGRLRQQWGLAARQKIEKDYTWDRVVERLAPFIEMAAQPVLR
jgi:glycosyltransferase involved in cell wall biosynthesis